MKAGTIAMSLLVALACAASAEEAYPVRPVSLVVPIAAGGGLDAVARLTARKFSAALGQPIVIENRAGGSQNIGIRSVAKATADGYTLLYASNTITINRRCSRTWAMTSTWTSSRSARWRRCRC